MAKMYEMLYKLNAQLGSGFDSAFKEASQALENVQDAMQELNQKQSDISAYQKQQTAVQNLQDKLSLLQTKLQNVSTEMSQSETYSSSLANKQATLQTQINQTARRLESEESKLAEMGDELQEAGIDTNDLTAESKKLEAELDDLTAEGKEAAAQVEELGESSASATDLLSGMTTAISAAGLLDALKELAEAAADCVTEFASFESTMSTVEALSGATGTQLDALTEKAEELGATTSFTATEAAEALTYMALAGYDTEEMLDSIDGVLNLAAAASMDLGTASDIVTDYLTAFGLSAEDSAEFVDQLAYAMSNSNTDVEQLGEAYKNVAATSTQLGYSLEDTTAALMVMADAGIKGGEAGTALASIMTRITNNTSGAADMLAAYGIEVYDTEGNTNELSSILGNLQSVWGSLTDEQKSNLAYTVAGKTAQSELMTVLGESTGAFETYKEGLESCTGAAEEMAAIQLDNLQGDLTLLESAVNGLQIAFGSALAPALTVVVEALTAVVTAISNFVSENQALVAGVAAAVAVIGGALAVITAVNGVLAIAPILIGAIGSAATAVLGPIGIAAAAIGVVVGVVTAVSNACSEAAVEWEDLGITAAEMGEMIAEGTITAEEAMETYGITEDQVTEATEAYAAAQEEAAAAEAEAYEALVESCEAMGIAESDMVSLSEAAELVADGYLTAEEAAEYFGLDADALTSIIEENEAEQEALATAVELVADGMLSAADAAAYLGTSVEDIQVEVVTDKLQTLIDTYDEVYSAAYDSITGQYTLWEEAAEESATSLDALNQNVQSQIDYWNDYNTNLETVSSAAEDLGIDLSGIWGDLTDGSEDAVNAVAGLAAALEAGDTEGFASYIESFNELQDAMSTVSETITENTAEVETAMTDFCNAIADGLSEADLASEFSASAADTIQGYIDGLDAAEGQVSTDLAAHAEEWLSNLNNALGVHSPSTITNESGVDTIQGFIDGVDSMSDSGAAAMTDAANAAINAFEAAMSTSAFYDAGVNAIQGAINGIAAMIPSLVAKAASAGTQAANAYKAAQDINSPSKLFEYFSEMDMEGAIQGIENKQAEVNAAFASAGQLGAASYQAGTLEAASSSGGSSTVVNFSPSFEISGVSDTEGVRGVLNQWTDELKDYILEVISESNVNSLRRAYV